MKLISGFFATLPNINLTNNNDYEIAIMKDKTVFYGTREMIKRFKELSDG